MQGKISTLTPISDFTSSSNLTYIYCIRKKTHLKLTDMAVILRASTVECLKIYHNDWLISLFTNFWKNNKEYLHYHWNPLQLNIIETQ